MKEGYEARIASLNYALNEEREKVARANQMIVDLRSADGTDKRRAEHAAEVVQLRDEISGLKSTLDSANKTIQAAREETERLKAEYDAQLARIQREKDELQAELTDITSRFIPGIRAFKEWMSNAAVDANTLVPEGSSSDDDAHNMHAHNALVRVRSKDWDSAFEDSTKSINNRPSVMGYFTKAFAQIGKGKLNEAIRTFDLAFRGCDPREDNLQLLIKAIVLYEADKYNEAISRVHDVISISMDDETTHCCHQVLARMHLLQDDYTNTMQSLEQAQTLGSPVTGSWRLEAVSLISGWSFDGIRVMAQRYRCETLCAAGCVDEAMEALDAIEPSEAENWVKVVKRKCGEMHEVLGDIAFGAKENDVAIARYTSALSLDPPNQVGIFLKRSQASAASGSWDDAIADAEEAVKQDPSSHRGYERKYAALCGAGKRDEARNALLKILLITKDSTDEEVRVLRENHKRDAVQRGIDIPEDL